MNYTAANEDKVIPLVRALKKNLLSADEFQLQFDKLTRPDRMRLLDALEEQVKQC